MSRNQSSVVYMLEIVNNKIEKLMMKGNVRLRLVLSWCFFLANFEASGAYKAGAYKKKACRGVGQSPYSSCVLCYCSKSIENSLHRSRFLVVAYAMETTLVNKPISFFLFYLLLEKKYAYIFEVTYLP